MVAEKADFYIEKVRYKHHAGQSRIVQVAVREDNGNKLGKPYNMARKKMIDLLHQGKRFMTIYRNPEGKYRRGKSLMLTQVNGVDYVQTEPTEDRSDRLNGLPEY